MTRFFNTAGPVQSDRHYCLPPLERLALADVMMLIEQQKYFVLHAPRQTGKTTALLELTRRLNAGGQYRSLYCNVELAQTARENVAQAMQAILGELCSRARITLGDPFPEQHWREVLDGYGEHAALNQLLTLWAEVSPLPLVIMLDEIDALVGDTLISVLRQVRSGYDKRPAHFPQSIILCGVRDVRDYRIHSDQEKTIITGGSAFNIKARSLRLGDFDQAEVVALYNQHTQDTGQAFAAAALTAIWELTHGQPWLVNALGYEVCFEMPEGRDRAQPITVELVMTAKERLILRRETHLDQLVDKLREERVRRVIEPILTGQVFEGGFQEDDVQYVLDLGLIRRDQAGGTQLANRIYQEVIPRALAVLSNLGKFQ